ncbi:hypothetical protein GH5_06021 [Leishmania sp. Ghana 2012 LV757]|uniref:hypothetical protein n=1 Tax=Leishmania sp. Ghana 2012 LV757 TaxID=2803181 RepID=UPI001B68A8F3|nr:hypothetical protein GH5_06021 [Leishmania sp. Ghana 2012 LV757]
MASVLPSQQPPFRDVEEDGCFPVRGTPFAAVADRSPPPPVEYVTYATLPRKWAPGPPIASAPSQQPRAAAQATAVVGNHALAVAPPLPASASQPSSSATETAASPRPPQPTSPRAVSVKEKVDSPFQAAQQFLFSSGASLLHYANPSLYLPGRSGADSVGGGGGTSTSGVVELSEEGQSNLLSSSLAAAALRERYDGVGGAAVSGSSSTIGSSGGGVDWKKMEWVRQQCRYTGEALLQSSVRAAHKDEAAMRQESAPFMADAAAVAAPPPPSAIVPPRPSPTATPVSTEVGEKSVGARLMQSLLYPFTQPTSSPAFTAVAPSTTVDNVVAGTVVPHGDGVMTYLLYCKPKTGGYGYPTGASGSETAGTGASSSPMVPVAPFLPPDLIPTAYCPPLTDIEAASAEANLASSEVVAAPSVPLVPPLLLLSLIVYEGAFVRGRRHGRGRLTAYGRMVLECTWSEDIPCLAVPWPISTAATSEVSPAPTLWNVDAHVWTPAAAKPAPMLAHGSRGVSRTFIPMVGSAKAGEARRRPSCATSGTWSVRASQAYMGSLMLATVASKKLFAKMEASMGSSGAFVMAKSVFDLRGTRYAALPAPHGWPMSGDANLRDAFCGLGWANHVVFLPDGFGEAHFRADGGLPLSAAPPASSTLTVSAVGGLFQPPLWVPEASSPEQHMSTSFTPPFPCWQYCGQWSTGLPHGFGAAAERITDPTATSLASSASTAGAGPPQYPWRSLFLGQYVHGKQRGPGTYHGTQGSEATEVVVCGTWPLHPRSSSTLVDAAAAAARATQEQTTANVVLLPVLSGTTVIPAADCVAAATASSPPPALSSSFFSLQGVHWSDNSANGGENTGCGGGGGGRSSGGGGGFFPAAKLRQSTAALSGMWEPLFRIVDEVVARQNPTLLFGDEEPGIGTRGESIDDEAAAPGASSSRKAVLWRRARRVMDNLVATPECVTALSIFHACFAFMYGADAAVVAPAGGSTAADGSVNTTPSSGPEEAALRMLHHLENAAPVPSSAATPMGFPWCPAHSWCAMAHLGSPPVLPRGPRGGLSFACCLHSGLSDGATHCQPPSTASRLGIPQFSGYTKTACSERSAKGALRRPPLSAAAAALEPFAAAHTFAHAMHAAAALVSSLRLRLLSCFAAYPDLCEAVMGDRESESEILQYCWDVTFGFAGSVLVKKATAVAVADVRLVWEMLGLKVEKGERETLTDYFVALRRCRTLTRADMISMEHAGIFEACGIGGISPLTESARRLGEMLEQHTATASTPSVRGARADRVSSELRDMATLLSQLHAVLGTAGKASCCVKGSADRLPELEAIQDAAMMADFTSAQREALLRWALFSAAVGHTAATPFASRSMLGRHPFAFLLIGHFLLAGRVTPAYPILGGDSSEHLSRNSLRLLLADMGRATRELMHTYPSIRSRALFLSLPPASMQASATSVVCPLDTLALKLEYVLSPCAALHLCASSCAHLMSGAAVAADSSSLQCGVEGGSVEANRDAGKCYGGAQHASIIHLGVQSLSREAQQCCQHELAHCLTVPLLEARLQRYWGRLAPGAAQQSSHSQHYVQVNGTSVRYCDGAPPPSPLMKWLLTCLQGVLSGPLQPQPVAKPSSDTAVSGIVPMRCRTSPASSQSPGQSCSNALPTRYTWKKFISAVFLSPAEREAWTSAHSPTTAEAARALSLMDSCYAVALAFALGELAGIELDLKARFVFEDDDDGENSTDADRQAASEAGGVAAPGGAGGAATSSLQTASLNQWRRERKNIFLSSSSSSSSISLSPSAASPPPRSNVTTENGVQRAASDAHTGSNSSRSGNSSCHECFPGDGAATASTPSSTPACQRRHASQRTPQLASAQETPRDRPPRGNGRVRSHVVATAGSAASPLMSGLVGKEWELTLVLQQGGSNGGEQQTAAPPCHAFFSTLTWEVMERVCSSVLHRLQATIQPGDAAENEMKKAKPAKARE